MEPFALLSWERYLEQAEASCGASHRFLRSVAPRLVEIARQREQRLQLRREQRAKRAAQQASSTSSSSKATAAAAATTTTTTTRVRTNSQNVRRHGKHAQIHSSSGVLRARSRGKKSAARTRREEEEEEEEEGDEEEAEGAGFDAAANAANASDDEDENDDVEEDPDWLEEEVSSSDAEDVEPSVLDTFKRDRTGGGSAAGGDRQARARSATTNSKRPRNQNRRTVSTKMKAAAPAGRTHSSSVVGQKGRGGALSVSIEIGDDSDSSDDDDDEDNLPLTEVLARMRRKQKLKSSQPSNAASTTGTAVAADQDDTIDLVEERVPRKAKVKAQQSLDRDRLCREKLQLQGISRRDALGTDGTEFRVTTIVSSDTIASESLAPKAQVVAKESQSLLMREIQDARTSSKRRVNEERRSSSAVTTLSGSAAVPRPKQPRTHYKGHHLIAEESTSSRRQPASRLSQRTQTKVRHSTRTVRKLLEDLAIERVNSDSRTRSQGSELPNENVVRPISESSGDTTTEASDPAAQAFAGVDESAKVSFSELRNVSVLYGTTSPPHAAIMIDKLLRNEVFPAAASCTAVDRSYLWWDDCSIICPWLKAVSPPLAGSDASRSAKMSSCCFPALSQFLREIVALMVPEPTSQNIHSIKDTCSLLLHQFIDAAKPVAAQLSAACTFAALQSSQSTTKIAGILRELENSLLTPCFSAYSQLGLRIHQRTARGLGGNEYDAIEDSFYKFLDTVFAYACHWLLVVRSFVHGCGRDNSSSTESHTPPVNPAVKGALDDQGLYFAIVERLCRRIFGDAINNRSYQILASLRDAENVSSNSFLCDTGRRVAMLLWHALSCLSSCISVGDEVLVVPRADKRNDAGTTASSSHDNHRFLVVAIDPWNDTGPVRLVSRESASTNNASRVETNVQFQDCTIVESLRWQHVLCHVESEVWQFLIEAATSGSDFGPTAEVPNAHVGTKLDACWKLCVDIVTPFGPPFRSVQVLAWMFSSHISAALVKAQLYRREALDRTLFSIDAAPDHLKLPSTLLSLRKHACTLLRANDGSRTTSGGIASRAPTEAPDALWRRCLQRCGRILASVSCLRDWLDLGSRKELLVSLAVGLHDFVVRDRSGGGNADDNEVINVHSKRAMQKLDNVRRVLSEGEAAVHLSGNEVPQVVVELDGILAVLAKWQRVDRTPRRLLSPDARTLAVVLGNNEGEDSESDHSDESSQEY